MDVKTDTHKKLGGPHWAWLPNSFTGTNLIFGFLAILFSLEAANGGDPELFNTACYLVLWAGVLDFFDGYLAKLTNSASQYGMKMDTFADAVTFGLAPAVLIVSAFLTGRVPPTTAWGAAGVYFLCAVWRLARYNLKDDKAPLFGFVGLPSPTAASVTVCFYVVTRGTEPDTGMVTAGLIILGLLMVSPLRYPAFKRLEKNESIVVKLILASMFLSMAYWTPEIGFGPAAAKAIFYFFGSFALVWGAWWVPTRHLWNKRLSKEAWIYRAHQD